jgi:hypothetical protein
MARNFYCEAIFGQILNRTNQTFTVEGKIYWSIGFVRIFLNSFRIKRGNKAKFFLQNIL